MLLLCFFPLLSLINFSQGQSYVVWVGAYNETEGSNVAVPFSLDGTPYSTTPDLCYFTYPYYEYLNINETDSYGGNFQYWEYQGYHYLDNTFYLDAGMDWQTVTAIYSGSESPPSQGNSSTGTSGAGNYTFYGLMDEDLGTQYRNSTVYSDGVYVTAYYTIPNTAPQRFFVNGTYGYNVTVTPQYFSYDLGSGGTREYWLGDDDTNVYNQSIYVFNSSSLTTISVAFQDLTGALNSYDLCSAQRYVNGSLLTVDKRKVDITDRVAFILKPLTLYTIKVSDGETYTFGDVTTSYTEIELVLKGIEFPQDVILRNQYIRFYGNRDNNTITVTYEDTQESTTSVYFEINYANGTTVYSATHTDENSFQDSWTNAIQNVTYRLEGIITTTYGTMTASQIFSGSKVNAYSPWSLEFLGSFPNGIDSSQIIPAVIILFFFGTFSVLNAWLGAFVGSIVYIFFAYMNWINVNSGIMIAALAFSIILAITFAKRRLLT